MIVKYSKSLYSKEVIIKTAYSFLDRCYVHLNADQDNFIIDIIYKDSSTEDEDTLKRELDEEIISQLARYTISEKTRSIRELIIGRAFSSSIIAEKESLEEYNAEYVGNAENILKNWFDTHE